MAFFFEIAANLVVWCTPGWCIGKALQHFNVTDRKMTNMKVTAVITRHVHVLKVNYNLTYVRKQKHVITAV